VIEALKVLLPAPLLILAAIAAHLLEGDRQASINGVDCVTGDAAVNPKGVNGGDAPRQEFFDSVAEAEAFLCVDLPEITAPGWRARDANALRSHSLDNFESGAFTFGERGFKYAELYYEDEGQRLLPTLIIQPHDLTQRSGIPISCFPPPETGLGPVEEIEVTIQGVETVFWLLTDPPRGMPSASVCWEQDGLTFFAGTFYAPGIDPVAELLPALQSIE
jgi:hypothetical protein